jgi:hypothetical protein
MAEYHRVEVFGAGNTFLAEKRDAVIALIDHGTLVANFLDDLQAQKEQEKTRLRVARKLEYVHRLSLCLSI